MDATSPAPHRLHTMETPPLDYRRLFEASPGLYALLRPDLTIAAASDAYLRATMTRPMP